MESKRLEKARQETKLPRRSRGGRTDFSTREKLTEELQTISPAFRKMSRKTGDVAPEQWRDLSQKLAERLENSNAPYWQTLRDKMSATDNHLVHWIWICVALLLLLAVMIWLTISLTPPEPAMVQLLPLLFPASSA